MFEIDRLHIQTKFENKQIIEEKYYAVFGNTALELRKELFIVNEDEEINKDFVEIYRQHLTEARAISMQNYLLKFQNNMDIFIKLNTLIEYEQYDTFRYSDYGDEKVVNEYIETAIHFLDSIKQKNSMIELDELAYFRAQKLFWEDKINDKLSKRDQEEIDKESDDKDE